MALIVANYFLLKNKDPSGYLKTITFLPALLTFIYMKITLKKISTLTVLEVSKKFKLIKVKRCL